MKLLPIWFFCALGLLSVGAVHAETADSEQPIQIFSDKFDGDDVKQVAIYTGDVAVHQGTLEIRGNKLVLTVDPQGYRHAVMTPLKGKLVTFKQRRDQKTPGVEEWMHGKGDELTYDEKRNVLILTHRAEVARSENGVLKDESKGDKITYNLTNSTAIIDGNKAKGPSGRVSTWTPASRLNFREAGESLHDRRSKPAETPNQCA